MRYLLAGLMLVVLLGCEDFEEALESERAPVSPPGIAPVGEMVELDTNGNNSPNNQPLENEPDAGSIIGKTTNRVVDKKKEMAKNPDLKVVENKVSGSDPLTVAASAYVSMRSKASTFGFQSALKSFKVVNDRPPTYDEFTQMMKENRIEFTRLYPYQMYGYDSDTGGIVILEDKADKKRRYKKAGIPLEE